MKIVKIILLPFAMLYGFIIQIRNWFYDFGIFKSKKFNIPVISVGNISVGGTGKTPVTQFLANHFSNRYKRIAIVSRGYGRKSKGVQLVASAGQIYLDAEQAGDEPLMLAHMLPKSTVIVSEKRTAGIEMAVNKFQADLIVLDDAFQHRAVKRDLDILLINSGVLWKSNYPMPAGTLREFKCNYKRAKIVLFTNYQENLELPFKPQNIKYFTTGTKLNELVNINGEVVAKISDFVSKKVLAFAGIAFPDNFFNSLKSEGLKIGATKKFKDHFNFTNNDINSLISKAEKSNFDAIICTEKDLVKIRELKLEQLQVPIFAARLNLLISNVSDFKQAIDEIIL